MKLSKEDIVLYSLDLLMKEGKMGRDYTKSHLSNAVGITENTLDLYLTRLKNEGKVNRIIRKYIKDLREIIEITDSGSQHLRWIHREIDLLLLTEHRHNIPSCVQLSKIMSQLRNPLEKAFILSLYNQSKYFDLPLFLNSIRLSRDDTNLVNVLCRLEDGPCGSSKDSFIESFFNISLYGEIDHEKLRSDVWPKEDIDALITLAQVKIRMGKFDDAQRIHDYLLTSRSDLTMSQWFMTKINCSHLLMKQGQLDGALDIIDSILPAIDNKVMRALSKLYKAEILFHKGSKETGLELYRSSILSFTTFGLPLFLTIAHNSRGVSYFIMGDMIEAEKEWLRARRYAKEAKSEFAEAKILPNLADIAIKKGKFDLARSLLDRAEEMFLKYSDYEGISVVELNRAFLCIEIGDPEGIRDHYRRCREVAFPLPPPFMLKIFEEDILLRCRERNIPNIESLIGLE